MCTLSCKILFPIFVIMQKICCPSTVERWTLTVCSSRRVHPIVDCGGGINCVYGNNFVPTQCPLILHIRIVLQLLEIWVSRNEARYRTYEHSNRIKIEWCLWEDEKSRALSRLCSSRLPLQSSSASLCNLIFARLPLHFPSRFRS